MFLGIDIGSSSSKAAIVDKDGSIICAKAINIGTGTKGIKIVVEQILREQNLCRDDVLYTVATGYGRLIYKGANTQITEISCHAKGVHHLFPDARSIIDIGGQDAKAIKLGDSGAVENFVMNEKCAAGTGRFFEVMARVLDCKIYDLAKLAAQGKEGISISSVCTVFAESEVISQLAAGASTEDVARGAHVAVAKRVAGLCTRIDMEPKIVMTGGVAFNKSMVKAMENELQTKIYIPENPQVIGAIGAAIFAREKYLRKKD